MTGTCIITGAGSGIGAAPQICSGPTAAPSWRRPPQRGRHRGSRRSDHPHPGGSRGARGRRRPLQGAREALEAAGGRVDAVIASARLSLPKAVTAAVNYYGAVGVLEELRPALAESEAPRAVVVSSMAPVQPNAPHLVDALLDGDEATAMAIAD